MKIHELSPAAGSAKPVKRIGRGQGSGNGKTAGKGNKGQKARSGGGRKFGFEGGQMPLQRRVPKRGFNNIFAKEIVTVSLSAIDAAFEAGAVADAAAMLEKKIIKKTGDGVKVLANGEITKPITVKVAAFSGSAKAKIEAAGGTAEVV